MSLTPVSESTGIITTPRPPPKKPPYVAQKKSGSVSPAMAKGDGRAAASRIPKRLEIGLSNRNSSVAVNINQGTVRIKALSPELSSNQAPVRPPARQTAPVHRARLSCRSSSRRYAAMERTRPGQIATAFEAFATTAATPVDRKVGKVKNVPPPATALKAEPIRPAPNNRPASTSARSKGI